MDFEFSQEQNMVRDSIQKFIRDHYELSNRRKMSKKKPGYSEDHWATYADLGWLGLSFPEIYGGFGGNLIDTMVLMEEFGKGLVLEPYFPTVVLAGNALLLGGNDEQRKRIIPGIVEGKVKATLAFEEEQARGNPADVAVSAQRDGGGFTLNGVKSLVLNAVTADWLVVSARTSGNRTDVKGITLFLVKGDAEGIKRLDYPTVDGLRASELTLTDVKVGAADVLGEIDGGLPVLEAVIERAILALGAEAVGAMEVLYRDTTEYTNQRNQFDHPLSAFQTVKHRIVDMFVETEMTRSLLYRATMETQGNHPDAKKDTYALKYYLGRAGRFIGQSAVQLHGGMGQTEELRIGHYFTRLAAMDAQFGNQDFHLARYTEMMEIPEGAAEASMMPF